MLACRVCLCSSAYVFIDCFAATSLAFTRLSIAVALRFEVCGRPMLISLPIIAVAGGTFVDICAVRGSVISQERVHFKVPVFAFYLRAAVMVF